MIIHTIIEKEISDLTEHYNKIQQTIEGNPRKSNQSLGIIKKRGVEESIIEIMDPKIQSRYLETLRVLEDKITLLEQVLENPNNFIASYENGEIIYRKK